MQPGFTLVELMLVVAIIGILAAIAVPAFSKYVKRSRTAEAVATVQKMTSAGVSYYEAEHTDSAGVVMPRQFPGAATVPTAGYCWPACGCQPKGLCDPGCADWNIPIWQALTFSLGSPYNYVPFAYAVAPTQFEARAVGDLTCNGVQSFFSRVINVNPVGETFTMRPLTSTNDLE
jgi:type IV pilus assembly protein PilA